MGQSGKRLNAGVLVLLVQTLSWICFGTLVTSLPLPGPQFSMGDMSCLEQQQHVLCKYLLSEHTYP